MNCYYMYADESGTMPVNDDEGPFVGALVGARSPISDGEELRGSPAHLIRLIKRAQATPWLTQVLPHPGYGAMVRAKYSKLNTMARARRLVTGRHEYLPPKGFSPANMVWSHCVTQTISPLLVREVFVSPLERLEVVFDRLTLADGERQLIHDKCQELPGLLRKTLLARQALNPPKVGEALANLRLSPDSVRIRWSDDPSVAGAEHGLRLAHWLARLYLRHLRGSGRRPFQALLANEGWCDSVTDVTRFVTAPIDRTSVEQWMNDTGLPEPEF